MIRVRSKTPISHWTAGRFCNGCLGGGAGSMSQGLRVLVLEGRNSARPFFRNTTPLSASAHPGPVECGRVWPDWGIAGSRDRATRTILSMTSGLIALWVEVQYENARNDRIYAHDNSRRKCCGRTPVLPGYVS